MCYYQIKTSEILSELNCNGYSKLTTFDALILLYINAYLCIDISFLKMKKFDKFLFQLVILAIVGSSFAYIEKNYITY